MDAPHRVRIRMLPLLIFSVFYGLFAINYIDHYTSVTCGYHLFLIFMDFAPFITLPLIYGARLIPISTAMGLIASLMNDLFYAPIGYILGVTKYNLYKWYMFQLGLADGYKAWLFDGLFFSFHVNS